MPKSEAKDNPWNLVSYVVVIAGSRKQSENNVFRCSIWTNTNYSTDTPYVWVKYINFTCILVKSYFYLTDRIFFIFISSLRLIKFQNFPINQLIKKNAGLPFLVGVTQTNGTNVCVTPITAKLRVKIIWSPYWKQWSFWDLCGVIFPVITLIQISISA